MTGRDSIAPTADIMFHDLKSQQERDEEIIKAADNFGVTLS